MKTLPGIIVVFQFKKIISLLGLFFFVTIMFSPVFISCNKDIDLFNEKEFDLYIKSLPPISDAMPDEKAAEIVSSEVDTTVEYIYKIDYYSAAAGFNEQIVLNPQTDVIYPGALVKGESILDGTYTLIPAKRKPIIISTSLTGAGSVSIAIEDPKLSTVREAVNALMDQEYDVPPANMGFTIEQAYSEEQLDLSLHASYKLFGMSVNGGFDYSNTKIKTRLVAKFIQNYYTLDMDLPNQPSDLFKEDVDKALFGTYMPMYISTVTFGRMALFTIESELDEKDVRAYLNGSYGAVDAQSSTDFESLKEKSTMKVYVLGGSGSSAGAIIDGFEAFKTYIKDGGNYSKESPGAPIAYKLRYIRDNSIGKIVFAASYPIRTAIPRTDNIVYDIKTNLRSFEAHASDAGGDVELYGAVLSYPTSLGIGANHRHWSGFTHMSESGTRTFAEDSYTVTNWTGLHQTDTIGIYINIKEEDDGPNDQYTIKTFEVPVAEIILGELNLEGYYVKTGLTVYDATDYIVVTFWFKPTMRRIK
ncbi:MAG: thiol-activated cytolysin family protein [Bacteroidota bacterium]|nr:thiol-activated cytolysin family protein [Bacteroidota bacterium]